MYEYNKLKYCPQCGKEMIFKLTDERERLFCPSCGYIIYRNPIPAANAIIVKNGKILLAKRKVEPRKGQWSLPGGFLEFEESPEQAAIRELFEETGLKIKLKDLITVGFSRTTRDRHVLIIFYSADIVKGRLKAGSDVLKLKYFDLNKLPKNMAFKTHADAIKEWRNKYKI